MGSRVFHQKVTWVIMWDKVGHQKLVFCLLQVLSPQARVKLLLRLRCDFLMQVLVTIEGYPSTHLLVGSFLFVSRCLGAT